MSGESTRKYGCHSPVLHGTSLGSTASRWTLPSEKNGTATTPLRCCLLDSSRSSRKHTPVIMRKIRRCQCVVSRLISSISVVLPFAALYRCLLCAVFIHADAIQLSCH